MLLPEDDDGEVLLPEDDDGEELLLEDEGLLAGSCVVPVSTSMKCPACLRANERQFYEIESDETRGHALLLGQVAGDAPGQGVLTNVK